MRFSNVVVAVYAALISQGNVVAALPAEARFTQGENIYGRSAPDSIENSEPVISRSTPDGNEDVTVATRDTDVAPRAESALSKRETKIFPEWPLSDNDTKWILAILAAAGIAYKNKDTIKKGGKKMKEYTWNKIPQNYRATMCLPANVCFQALLDWYNPRFRSPAGQPDLTTHEAGIMLEHGVEHTVDAVGHTTEAVAEVLG